MAQLNNFAIEPMMFRNLINGEWIEPRSGKSFKRTIPRIPR